jgi:type IV secretory pathway TraG/TraD family ATPase VirD4
MLSKVLGVNEENKAIMNLAEIRTMKNKEAIFLMTNKLPLKLDMKAYYKNRIFKSYTNLAPYKINHQNFDDTITYIDIN